jgi:hypothetical protein
VPAPLRSVLTAVAVVAAMMVVSGPAPPAHAAPGPDVFLLGDSVLAGATPAIDQTILPSYPGTVIDAAVCRGLVVSCTSSGAPSPPTTGMAEIAGNAGRIGDVMVVELGYNDSPSASSIDAALAALTQQEVPLVLWVGLSTLNRPEFAAVNARLAAATSRWPTMRVLDWDGVSHGHPDWFIPDDGVGVHLTPAGASAFASWLKSQLDAIPGIGVPPPAAQHCSADVAIGTPSAPLASTPTGTPGPDAGFTGTAPSRLLDSRAGRPLGAGHAIELQIAGRAGVPKGASAAALNVTAVDPCGAGFLTVYPCGDSPPLASNVNYGAHDARPNLAVARLSAGGRVCIYSMVQTDVVVDLMGWFTPDRGDAAVAARPTRLLDTRQTTAVAAGGTIGLTVTGPGAAPAGATGAILNVTAVDAEAAGFVTVWPAAADGSCDPAGRPGTSNVNVAGTAPLANLVMVRVVSGRVCLFSFSRADLVVDLDGWFATGAGTVQPRTPARVLDTRAGVGVAPGAVPAGGTVAMDLGGGAILNVTAVLPSAPGFMTVWPATPDGSCSPSSRPLASNLNYGPGQVVANLVVSAATAGRICVYTQARSDIVVDAMGDLAS